MVDTAASIRVYTGPVDLDVTASLALLRTGGADPSVRIAGRWAWLATPTASGPATLAVTNLGPRTVEAHAWGPGAPEVLQRLPQVVGFGDHAPFAPSEPRISRLARRHAGLRMPALGRVLHPLISQILGQKVTTVEAHRSYHRLVRRFGDPAPGPAGLLVPPTGARLGELSYVDLHPIGVERRRAEALLRCARREARLDRAAQQGSAELQRVLMSFPGMGPWTASGVARVVTGDPDVVVVGDLHIPGLVGWVLAGEPDADDQRMLELLAPFPGHRGRVQVLVKRSGNRPPRRAPKARVRSYERM